MAGPETLADDVMGRLRKSLAPADAPGRVEGAVLVLLRPSPGGHEVVLTTRHRDMRSHPGQVAFPGGHLHENEGPLQAALREAHEEIGVPPDQVHVLVHMGDHLGPGWMTIRAVVGGIASDVPFAPDPREVDDVFTVALCALAAPSAHESRMLLPQEDVPWSGHVVHVFRTTGVPIWGFTAGILARLLDWGLGWEPPRPPRVVATLDELRAGLP